MDNEQKSWMSLSRLPGCDGQAADAVSAHTQVKMEDAHKLLKIPKSECPDIWIVYHDTNGQNHGPVWKTQPFLLNGICMVILCMTVMGRAIWENPIAARLGEGFQLGLLVRTPWKRIILICACRWHQIGRKENINPMWIVLNKEVDLGDLSLIMCTWSALKDNVK